MTLWMHALERLGRWGLVRQGAQSLWFSTSVGRVHALRMVGQGSLAPVVMLHGLGASALSYTPLLRRLSPQVQEVIAIDTPAHGFSDFPTQEIAPPTLFQGILETLPQLPHASFVLVGNSLGGGMALRFALLHPSYVKALVLMSPAGAPTPPEEHSAFLGHFDIQKRRDASLFVDHLFHQAPWYRPVLVSFIQANFRRPMLKQFLSHVRTTQAKEEYTFKPEELPSLAMPIYLIWGKADRIMPMSHLPFFRAHLPAHAVLFEPPNAGHSPHVEQPRLIAQSILAFLQNLPVPCSGAR